MAIDVTDRVSAGDTSQSSGVDDRGGSQDVDRAASRHLQLNQIARIDTLGVMAAALAHEINQPLAAIGNYTAACQDVISQTPGLSATWY